MKSLLPEGPPERLSSLPAGEAGRAGNWWGHTPPAPLFTAGVDSNGANVQDSHPYGWKDAWFTNTCSVTTDANGYATTIWPFKLGPLAAETNLIRATVSGTGLSVVFQASSSVQTPPPAPQLDPACPLVTFDQTPLLYGTVSSTYAGYTLNVSNGGAVIASTQVQANGYWSMELPSFPDGTYYFSIQMVNPFLGIYSAYRTIALTIESDLVPPALTINQPAEGITISLPAQLVFNVSYSDSDSGVNTNSLTIALNNTPIKQVFGITSAGASYYPAFDTSAGLDEFAVVYNALLNGSNELKATIADNVGNIRQVTRHFIVTRDTLNPLLAQLPAVLDLYLLPDQSTVTIKVLGDKVSTLGGNLRVRLAPTANPFIAAATVISACYLGTPIEISGTDFGTLYFSDDPNYPSVGTLNLLNGAVSIAQRTLVSSSYLTYLSLSPLALEVPMTGTFSPLSLTQGIVHLTGEGTIPYSVPGIGDATFFMDCSCSSLDQQCLYAIEEITKTAKTAFDQIDKMVDEGTITTDTAKTRKAQINGITTTGITAVNTYGLDAERVVIARDWTISRTAGVVSGTNICPGGWLVETRVTGTVLTLVDSEHVYNITPTVQGGIYSITWNIYVQHPSNVTVTAKAGLTGEVPLDITIGNFTFITNTPSILTGSATYTRLKPSNLIYITVTITSEDGATTYKQEILIHIVAP